MGFLPDGASTTNQLKDRVPGQLRMDINYIQLTFGSRLSLVGSRSQGDFPQKDDSAASTPARETSMLQQASEPPSKRASFIE
ncbi:unnamed protein product, partial [Timema podura]|nr:unnamed protein product [Timema podura]